MFKKSTALDDIKYKSLKLSILMKEMIQAHIPVTDNSFLLL